MNINNHSNSLKTTIAYVPESFPQISETFVINEIKGMLDLGFRIALLPRIEGVKTVQHKNYLYIKNKVKIYQQEVMPSFIGFVHAFNRGAQNISLKQMLRPKVFYQHICNAMNIARHANRIVQVKPEVVLVHFGFDNAVAGAIASKILGCPLILWLHGSDVYTVPHRSIKWFTNTAALIITSSEDNKERLKKLGVTKKTVVANLGVSKDFFEDNIEKDTSPLLVSVARLGHNKNLKRTLRIISLVKKIIPNIMLLIAGDGPDRQALEKYTKKLDLDSNIGFLGFVTQKEVSLLLKRAWVKLLFSDQEGKPVSIMEAQARKLPCVVSNVGGLSEIICHDETGYLIDFSDSGSEELAAQYIVDLLENEELRNSMGRAAYKNAKKKFSEENHFDFMAKNINGLIEDEKCQHQ